MEEEVQQKLNEDQDASDPRCVSFVFHSFHPNWNVYKYKMEIILPIIHVISSVINTLVLAKMLGSYRSKI